MIKRILLFFTVIFGAVTLFMSSSVIFDWFGIRAKEGNFIPAIVWANWICGILYLIAAYGIFKRRIWARKPIIISLLLLFVGSVYLIVHISNGGPYETKTVGAMAFRVVITLLLLFTTIKLFKMKKSILATLLGLAVVISCEQKHSTTETEDHADHTGHVVADTETQASDDDHADPSAAFELDNGKKWTTNPEMLPYINEQKQLIDEYDSDKDDYKKLASSLDAANQNLIKSCTMKGKSHDVLHVWLTDHMKNIDALGKATTAQKAEKIVDQLEDSMGIYVKYFS